MLFNSLQFLIFFPLVVMAYFATPHRWRWLLLLVASYYFYMCWKPIYILLIIGSTLLDYTVAREIYAAQEQWKKRLLLTLSLLGNFGTLFVFKYLDFFNESLHQFLPQINPAYNVFHDMTHAGWWVLPVGISFYTFQTVSYTIDVYRGVVKPERHLGYFAVYVSFFPQLVAGPIERPGHLLPELRANHKWDANRVASGIAQMVLGFFKKVVISDRLAAAVDTAYNSPHDLNGLPLLIATYFFAFQIYCDFSGYSDIAIGAARIMGIDLMENFRRPYLSQSMGEFWRRWHISLSTWFRDYVYLPLGGNRVQRWRWVLNLFIVFLVSGLWHGANWTFIVWGALHGAYVGIEVFLAPLHWQPANRFLALLKRVVLTVWTFHLALIGWVFFRANTVSDAFYILRAIPETLFEHIASLVQNGLQAYITYLPLGITRRDAMLSVMLILFLVVSEIFVEWRESLEKQPASTRWFAGKLLYYDLLFIGILTLGVFTNTAFIYFQF